VSSDDEKEKNAIVISLAQADFDIIRHLEQGMEVAQLRSQVIRSL